jgi:hypothetical protein
VAAAGVAESVKCTVVCLERNDGKISNMKDANKCCEDAVKIQTFVDNTKKLKI